MALGFWRGLHIERQLEVASDALLPAAMQSRVALTAFQEQVRSYQNAIVFGDADLLDHASDKANDCQAALQLIGTMEVPGSQRIPQVYDVIQAHADFTQRAIPTYQAMVAGEDGEGVKDQASQLYDISKRLESEFSDIASQLVEDLKFEMTHVGDTSRSQRYINLLIFTMVLVCSIVAVRVILSRSLIRPLRETLNVMQLVAKGDLTQSLKEQGAAELCLLAKHFNAMVGELKNILIKVQNVAGEIDNSGRSISDHSRAQSNGVVTQTSAVAQTTVATAELAKSNEHIGESIKEISSMSLHVLEGMEKIKETTGHTSDLLETLNRKSKEIESIVQLIDGVASQTNLLAVNASIEAARAGEHGKGFSVVADQITKLADSTSRSTKDIANLIELIQHEMAIAIESMNQSMGYVEEEIYLAKESSARSQDIAVGTTQQMNTSKLIAAAMSDIDVTMKNISVDAQQSAQEAGSLSELAYELQEYVSEFRT